MVVGPILNRLGVFGYAQQLRSLQDGREIKGDYAPSISPRGSLGDFATVKWAGYIKYRRLAPGL